MLFAALPARGLISFMRMDVNDSPDIVFPAVQVTVAQPGAAPPELETQVTQRVEAAIRGIDGIEEINSTVREGSPPPSSSSTWARRSTAPSTTSATRSTRIRSDLPDGILEPQVQRVDFGGEIALLGPRRPT